MPVYCPPDKFKKAILESLEQDELTDDAIMYLMRIANEVSKKLKYKNPKDREDCISTALETVLKYWRGYNPEISNYPFAYYTQMISHALAKGWHELHPIKSVNKISLSNENIHSFE